MDEHVKSHELLDQLFGEVEEGWRERRDRILVYRIAEKYPELREELYEFFEALIVGDSAETSSLIAEAENQVSQWVQSFGVDLALSAAKKEQRGTTSGSRTPANQAHHADDKNTEGHAASALGDNWIAFLRQRLKRPLPEIANALPNVTVEYLTLVSRHPKIVPRTVCSELAALVERQWRVPAKESLEYLKDQSSVVRAASRARPFDRDPTTFKELLDRAALTQAARDYWVRQAAVD